MQNLQYVNLVDSANINSTVANLQMGAYAQHDGSCAPGMLCDLQFTFNDCKDDNGSCSGSSSLQTVQMYGSNNVDSSVAAGGQNAYVNMDGSSNYGSTVGNLQTTINLCKDDNGNCSGATTLLLLI